MLSKIYGYWIGKNDIHEVRKWGHEEAAYDILEKVHGINRDSIEGAYDLMFYLGYVRVVNDAGEEGGHKAQSWPKAKHSRLQKQFIKEAEITDDWLLLESEIENCKRVLQQVDQLSLI